MWAGASLVDRAICLGTPIGRGITGDDVSDRGFDRMGDRLEVLSQASMSWTVRVLAVNMFLFSIVSYPNRLFLVSSDRTARITNQSLRFITPVPFCTYGILSHCVKLFRIACAPMHLLFDNIAAVLSTAYLLQRRGVIDEIQASNLQNEVMQLCSDDTVPIKSLIGAPRPLLHFVVAASLFWRITGITPDRFLLEMAPRQPDRVKLHGKFYSFMIEVATLTFDSICPKLRCRFDCIYQLFRKRVCTI